MPKIYLIDVTNRASEIFESSEPKEKQQFLNFLLQNCRVSDKKLLFDVKKPFVGIVEYNKVLNGSGGGIRTHNQSINSRLLCR